MALALGVAFASLSMWAEAEYAVGMAAAEADRAGAAHAHLKRAAEIWPATPYLRRGPAEALFSVGGAIDAKAAHAIMDTAIERDPYSADLMRAAAMLRAADGDVDGAVRLLRRGVETVPGAVGLRAMLRQVQEQAR